MKFPLINRFDPVPANTILSLMTSFSQIEIISLSGDAFSEKLTSICLLDCRSDA